MLIIETINGIQASRWIGNGLCDFYNRIAEIIAVQADGDELDWIVENTKNVPLSTGPVTIWYGDMARFVFMNIRWEEVNKKPKTTSETKKCFCGNPEHGFDCTCDWVKNNPGNDEFTCEYCGIYTASKSRCNSCVKTGRKTE